MHCFPNPAPGELQFPEAGTTWPSGPTGFLPALTTTPEAQTLGPKAGGLERSRSSPQRQMPVSRICL